jgi:hypothetical protein
MQSPAQPKKIILAKLLPAAYFLYTGFSEAHKIAINPAALGAVVGGFFIYASLKLYL